MSQDRRGNIASVLEGFQATGGSDVPASAISRRHLKYFGASLTGGTDGAECSYAHGRDRRQQDIQVDWHLHEERGSSVTTSVSWRDPATSSPLDEPRLQARSGLMEAHGRNEGFPRRLGIDLVSSAAGVLDVQAMLATLLSQARGGSVRRAETSAMGAGLVFMSQYVAAATCADPLPTQPPASEPGPPFFTADGHWFELEALDGGIWKGFWDSLGVHGPLVGTAWLHFVQRYATGRVSLPAGLHEATRRHTLAEAAAAAAGSGSSICRIRTSDEVIEELRSRAGQAQLVPPPWAMRLAASADGAPALPDAPPGAELPLAGLRIVEATRRIQGPLCGLLLQMLGAEVIRIEPPGGDSLRAMSPLAAGCSARFLALNRDKPVVEIDLKTPGGRKALLDLVGDADAFVHNLAPGKSAAVGLEAEDMWAVNPNLVYAYASGWGSAMGERPPVGTDFLVQAHTALGEALNPVDEPPFNSLVTITDMMGGLVACEGTLGGLLLRSRTGRGCRVDTSLLSGSLGLQADRLEALAGRGEQSRKGRRPGWEAWDRPLRTADGYLMLTLGRAGLTDLCRITGVADGSGDVTPRLQELFATHPSRHWTDKLDSVGIESSPVCTDLTLLARDPSTARFFDTSHGCALVRSPWRFST